MCKKIARAAAVCLFLIAAMVLQAVVGYGDMSGEAALYAGAVGQIGDQPVTRSAAQPGAPHG